MRGRGFRIEIPMVLCIDVEAATGEDAIAKALAWMDEEDGRELPFRTVDELFMEGSDDAPWATSGSLYPSRASEIEVMEEFDADEEETEVDDG